ncbi:PREDICTED: uncharacterized protein LOC105959256 [Erythranthe guttata]|uniref:uncharacterized protein LOC105959256 n=1 Tax=Erythranthe guttata TaxID=4155 RepID=UPI00064DB279|nr:PREDICTED: uncharacterized protein LOC105959256 [Erythranthe guttata]|eukprot:XP_012838770.1 PREDICTED: uncharacterized protein LOC105959256 [Erythranthe guttata]
MAISLLVEESVTNQEIARYWKQRRTVEDEHFYAAIKASARLRARNLSDYEYRKFQELLEDDEFVKEDENKETRVGIKDWWTKSKYAYLNEPAAMKVDNQRRRRRRSYTYLPQNFICKFGVVIPSNGY